ncbi:MAG: hypothetical protein JWM33_2553, partial [Caulobacteraceae bacterium]|nr:hypothetical protein [Caulobacteraceae bacterium]
MWRSYLAAALRNLARNRLHSVITTLSLAIGFTGVILASLFWHYEHTYDRFWPNADRVSLIAEWSYPVDTANGWSVTTSDAIEPGVAARIRLEAPQAVVVARTLWATMQLEHGVVRSEERQTFWADPNLFSVLKPRRVAGDLDGALRRPNTIVLTRGLARKYFGDADPIGQVIEARPRASSSDSQYRGEPFTVQVTAVIEDMPVNSHVRAQAFVSGLTSGSPFHS